MLDMPNTDAATKGCDPGTLDNPEVSAQNSDASDGGVQKAFLKELALTGDIEAATIAAGYSDSAVFLGQRTTDVAFSELWDEAMDAAYMRMESALLSYVMRAVTAAKPETEPKTLAVYFKMALSLLTAHRRFTASTRRSPRNAVSNARIAVIEKLTAMRSNDECKGVAYESAECKSAECKSTHMANSS